jgi:hypothetical protein
MGFRGNGVKSKGKYRWKGRERRREWKKRAEKYLGREKCGAREG